MITRFFVKNFKSLTDFEIKGMGSIVCLVGINGAGKTSFLQFLSFLKNGMLGNASRMSIEDRSLDIKDFLTIGQSKRLIEVEVDMQLPAGKFRWRWGYNAMERQTSYEEISPILNDTDVIADRILTYREKRLVIGREQKGVSISAVGSVLSLLDTSEPALEQIRDEISSITGVGVLDPVAISAPTQTRERVIHLDDNGKNLPAFLSRLSESDMAEWNERICAFYGKGQIDHVAVKGARFGWKRIVFSELSKTLDSIHLSYGTLRFMVMAAMKYSPSKIVFFDEVENGLSQEVLKDLLLLFKSYDEKQVFITTHNVLFLNYFDDDLARDSVFFMFKDDLHRTRATRFFEPNSDKYHELLYQGAGEVVSMTNLREYAKDISSAEKEVSR